MMPPECTICGRGFREEVMCELIDFKKTDKDREWDKTMKEKRMVGHPPYEHWFCLEHAKIADKYKNLSSKEAFEKIRTDLKK